MSPGRRSYRAIAVGAVVSVSAVLAFTGYFAMFSSWEFWDDEGDWLIGLQSYMRLGGLYHRTWSQAGPFYYEVWSAVFSAAGAVVDTDSGRVATLAVWILAAAVIGAAVVHLTRSVAAGVLAQIASFLVLYTLVGEPMEPAGLGNLLVAVSVLGIAMLAGGRRRSGAVIVGGAVAALVLTKVNLGVFAVGGVGYAAIVHGPVKRWVKGRHLLAGALIALVPVALMWSVLATGLFSGYLTVELLGVAGIVVTVATARRSAGSDRRPSGAGQDDLGAGRGQDLGTGPAMWGSAAFLATTLVVALGVLGNGTSLAELVHGALLAQRNLAKIFRYPLPVSGWNVVWAGAGLVVAVIVAVLRHRGRFAPGRFPSWIEGAVRLGVGLWMLAALIGGVLPSLVAVRPPHVSFLPVLPLAWVGLLEPSPQGSRGEAGFARTAIVAMSVLLTLEAFPVDGSQLWWAGLGMVVVSCLVVSDGVTILRYQVDYPQYWVPSTLGRPILVAGCLARTAMLAILVGGSLLTVHRLSVARYRTSVPTGLTGASLVRWPPSVVAADRKVVRLLERDCSTFESLPGLNSFYFLAAQKPPTGLNTTQWMYLMSDSTQRRIVRKLKRVSRLCVLEEPSVLPFWQQGKKLPSSSPLLAYIRKDFVPFRKIGGYVLLRRPPGGAVRQRP